MESAQSFSCLGPVHHRTSALLLERDYKHLPGVSWQPSGHPWDVPHKSCLTAVKMTASTGLDLGPQVVCPPLPPGHEDFVQSRALSA